MKFKADLGYQNQYTVIKDCEIEKTVRLSREEFNAFSDDLLEARGFIRENKDLMFRDGDSTYHCLLVTGEGHEDGVLVYADGRDYANYACHVPDAQALLTASRYPSLAGFTNRMAAMADYLVEQAVNLKPGESSATVRLDDLESVSGIGVPHNSSVVYALRNMLDDRPEIADWELDGGAFTLTPAPSLAEQAISDGPEMTQQF